MDLDISMEHLVQKFEIGRLSVAVVGFQKVKRLPQRLQTLCHERDFDKPVAHCNVWTFFDVLENSLLFSKRTSLLKSLRKCVDDLQRIV